MTVLLKNGKLIDYATMTDDYFDILIEDDKIKEICIYKEKYRESSMQELASIISLETGTKITKSGINHRFRKIKEMVK